MSDYDFSQFRKTPWRMQSPKQKRSAIFTLAVPLGMVVILLALIFIFRAPARFGGWVAVVPVVIIVPASWVGVYLVNRATDDAADELKAKRFKICSHCRYDLSSHADEGTCPECGKAYTQPDLEKAWRAAYPMHL